MKLMINYCSTIFGKRIFINILNTLNHPKIYINIKYNNTYILPKKENNFPPYYTRTFHT